ALFHAARDADYDQIAQAARDLAKGLGRKKSLDDDARSALASEIARLKRRVGDIVTIDFFGAPGREAVDGVIAALQKRLEAATPGAPEPQEVAPDYRARTWVTRQGIHVDRMASAWLIRRFIDADATFKFVSGKGYRPAPGELRFDMYDAEFTHEGD